MNKVSDLTERTAEIRSSDDKELGVVEEFLANQIVMHTYVGKKGMFILPEDMIWRIEGGTVYLNLTEEEFMQWWKLEGPKHIAKLESKLRKSMVFPTEEEALKIGVKRYIIWIIGSAAALIFILLIVWLHQLAINMMWP